ncbi:Pam16-domain-containing protein, partial [Multifurca ochricompacta]
QSAPKLIIQILITGTQIFGKALLEAGRQAAKSICKTPSTGGDRVGCRGCGECHDRSLTDRLTREHRMTLDEAHLILNAKRGDKIEQIVQNYEHLFKANGPAEAPPKAAPAVAAVRSHYLQSKVVRARERIEQN